MTDALLAPFPKSSSVHEEMNRFEVKYLVATRGVPALLDEFADYTVNDPHDHGAGYHVHSIYWDTSDFRFFWEKIEGSKYRRKLRFRRYDRTAPVMVEIKQREDRTVQKRRVVWSLDRVAAAFGDGRTPVDWDKVQDDVVATEVALLIDRLRLRPRMAVSYRRRALFGKFDRELRVTFDGRIQYHHARLDIGDIFDTGRYALDPRVTVLEIKYNHRAPVWMTKAVARHGLQMVRMSKYCNAVDRFYYDGMNT
ncbi:MAG TPA: polyphosphate polymerase domain-containing protein [Gemmatimonadales bacterium]|jgi:SPX domain protein involved in polyphosphate accumulation